MKKLFIAVLFTTFCVANSYGQSGSTLPYNCWTKWEFNGNDYKVEYIFYKLPQNSNVSFWLVGLTDRARRTLSVSNSTGGLSYSISDSTVRVTLTAGYRARSAGPYGSLWSSSPWNLGREVRLEYRCTR